jgi:hypothetical protein
VSIPIYSDDADWDIVDPTGETVHREWHPMNSPARRLCQCLEGIRDLRETIDHVLAVHNRSKRRRRIRSVVVPLHSLCVSLRDLINSIASDRTIADRLPLNYSSDLASLMAFFRSHVPWERSGKLALIRNKTSAHYDRDMWPADLREVSLSVDVTETAEWINLTISVLCDVLKLDAFMWSGGGYAPNGVMIMCTEPIMTDFKVEAGNVVGINGCYVSKSPKWKVYDALKSLAAATDKMFERHSRWRIKEFLADPPQSHWSKTLREAAIVH